MEVIFIIQMLLSRSSPLECFVWLESEQENWSPGEWILPVVTNEEY